MPAYIVFNDKTLVDMVDKKPQSLDEMAKINGVGAKKLETYGAAFLAVIVGAQEELHPARRKLAFGQNGALYDELLAVQADLLRGPLGTDKPLTCSASQLAKLAQMRPKTQSDIEKCLGEKKAERFGTAFLDVFAAMT